MKLSTVDAFKRINTDTDTCIILDDELLHRYQKAILKIAEDIVSVCEQEKITWHLTGGTALGAVRHHGFIPWDDDIDLDILGNDFDRFVNAFRKKFGDKYWIHTCDTPNYGMVTYRVRLKGSIFRAREDLENDEAGFYVDINRIENTFNNPLLRYIHGIFCMGMGFFLSCRNFFKNRKLMVKLSEANPDLRTVFLFKIVIGALLSFRSVTDWTILTQDCYALCKNNQSFYVSVPAGRKHYFGELYRRRDFVETAPMEFEGHIWKVPKEYDAYLNHMYGDYMKIPKESDRERHILLELKFPEE